MSDIKDQFISGDTEGLEKKFNSLKSFYLSNKENISDKKIWKNVLKNGWHENLSTIVSRRVRKSERKVQILKESLKYLILTITTFNNFEGISYE